jgi:hypothetical protein
MNLTHLSTAAVLVVLATCGAGRVGGFVIGRTTVAEVEQTLGAPLDTTMRPDGALTLVYDTARLAQGQAQAARPEPGQTISLRFGTDFVLRGTEVSASTLVAANGPTAK